MTVHGVLGRCKRGTATVGRISFRGALGVNLESRKLAFSHCIRARDAVLKRCSLPVRKLTSVVDATKKKSMAHTLGAIMGRDDSSERPMLLRYCDSRRIVVPKVKV